MLRTLVAVLACFSWPLAAAEISLESAPPVVVRTEPVAGAAQVDPRTSEIVVQFSKKMQDGSWSWSTWGEDTFPEMVGQPRYLPDGRTCVLSVKLQPGKFYATWLNSDKFKNFKDAGGRAAVPYLLTFRTRESSDTAGGGTAADFTQLLNDDQRAVLAWTDRQFRSYFDARTFEGWSGEERAALERKLIDALNGPRSTEYYQAINTLAAMRSTKALPRLREIAFERVDRNNRDRWMCIRALGIIGDKESVPELIHLVYHGNVNTRWWAQISLVQITGKNFGKDWNAWGKWWNDQNGQPPYKPEIIRWWNGQAEPDKLAESLEEGDQKFFESLKPKSAAASTPAASGDVAAKLRNATPLMDGIRESWSAAVEAMQGDDATSALASLRILAPRIQEFVNLMKGTALEAGAAESLETLKSLMTSLAKGDKDATQTALAAMTALGQKMEQQVKAATDTPPMPAPEPVSGLANALVLKRDDGIQTGVQSIAASGQAVQFQRSRETRYEARYVEAVQFFGSRYGTPEPPPDDFYLYLLNEQEQVLAELKFPYAMIERGDARWYTLRTPSIEVPEKFTVALSFNPHQTKGVYLAYSAISGEACHSLIGLPGDGFRFWKPVEWMVRVSLTAEPSKAKGFQALADWKPPVAQSPLANCRVVSFGGDKSEGQQSYGDRGPAIRFKPAELLAGVRANAPLTLKGVRLYASRYGSGYSPEETKLHVILRGANDAVLAEKDFAYAKFGYKADWVDLVFDQPVKVANPGEPMTIAFDPKATQNKGVYFHYQKNPATSHSLAGNVSSGFKEVTDREWMVRACFE
jgi:RNA polymerase sigma-70 factor (ECF subfamily)